MNDTQKNILLFAPEVLVLLLGAFLALYENEWQCVAFMTFVALLIVSGMAAMVIQETLSGIAAFVISLLVMVANFFLAILFWVLGTSVKHHISAMKFMLDHDAQAYINAVAMDGSAEEVQQAQESLDNLNTYLDTLNYAVGPWMGSLGMNPVEFLFWTTVGVAALKWIICVKVTK